MARQKLIHIHSFVNGKAPSSSTVSFGEIAVNCNSNSPKLYIKTAAASTETTAKIESFSPDSVIDKKFVIVKGDADNSAVLKGGNNQVISEGSVALGKDNFVGLKGWYYKAVQINNDSNVVYLYLTTEQQIPILVSTANAVENQEKDININISKGDICSIINGNRLIDCFEFRLNEISNYGRISFTYKGEGTNPLSTIQNVEELKLEDYSVFCISKPSCGIVDLSKCNIALGNNTKSLAESSVSIGLRSTAVGITSYAEGQDTIAVGECSHAEGAFTKSNGIASHTEGFGTQTEGLSAHAEGYNTLASGGASHSEGSATKATGLHSHAEGDTTEASGEQSHAEGKQTIAEGEHSHSEGYWTKAHGKSSHVEGQGLNNTTYSVASGDYSHSEGFYTRAFGTGSHTEGTYTIAYNKGEHAEGIYNKSTENVTLHSVGIGTSVNDRKNAHEITNDGKHYIYGVGGYDGTNPDTSYDIATYLPNMVNITYKALSDLKSNSKLVPGQQYRITDYVTTTTQSYTQSAGHPFDVIVTADDINVLNENARAIQREDDVYFGDSNLNAWELKYCLDNDTNRFAWADANKEYTIELPVSDNIRNHIKSFHSSIEVPNTLIAKWWDNPHNGDEFDYYEIINVKMLAEDVLMIAYPCGNIPQNGVAFPEFITSSYGYSIPGNAIYLNCQPTECIIDTIPTVFENENGKGVIYYMKDEFNNECPYDFKNIQFARWELSNPVGYRNDYDFENYEDNWIQEESTPFDSLKTGFYGLNNSDNVFTYAYNEDIGYYKYKVEYTISESPTYCYTFGKGTDYSMNGSNYGNVIKEYKSNNKIQLNNIVFLGTSCYSNSFGNNCYSNSFGNRCYDNSFGTSCYSNSFGNGYSSNSFGNYCYDNSFGEFSSRNSFGNNCSYNSFGEGCYNNSFGYNCFNNSFGNSCDYNSFGSGCEFNSFGNICDYNSFGTSCYSNSFGNGCYYNSFGTGCSSNSFRTNNSTTATLLNYCRYNHFDDGCSYNIVYNTTTTGSNNQLQNININRGVSGTYSKHNTISIDTLNANYEIQVAKNSSGDIKIYCEADLIA